MSDDEEETEIVETKKNNNNKELTFDSDSFTTLEYPVLQHFIPGVNPPIQIDTTITIYGKRRTGKSVFIKWFLQFFKHEIPWGWVFTLTKFNSFYATFMPKKFIIDSFDGDKMQMIMKRQKIYVKTSIDQKMENRPDPLNPMAVIIWDDYMGNDVRFNKMLQQYYYTGRHYATLNIFATQYVSETPPAIRTNTDLAVIFNTDHRHSLEMYAENFSGKMDKNVFIQFLKKATEEEHSFLVINNDPNISYKDRFYSGKAEMLDADPRYIIGCRDYWMDSRKQLSDLVSGKMQRRMELRAELTQHKHIEANNPKHLVNTKNPIVHIDQVDYKEKSKSKFLNDHQIKSSEQDN